MKRFLFLAVAVVFCFLPVCCGSENPKKDADLVRDELTGQTPIEHGRRMRDQVGGIVKEREDQAKAAEGE